MTGLEMPVALFLLANLVVAMLATARGPTAADRMLIALLVGTTGAGIVVLLAYAEKAYELIDVALILAVLAAIAGIAFARRSWRGRESNHD